MKWEEFLKLTKKLPVIDTENLFAGVSTPNSLLVQISRWHKAGKLIQLKRGVYLVAEPYVRVNLNELYIASILKKPSYISLEKALEYHSLIPEAVSVYTSVTTKRPGRFVSRVGIFDYRHIKTSLFWGYDSLTVNKHTAFISSPEKGLLDLLYLKQIKVSIEYLKELRLQNVDNINLDKLFEYARRFKKTGILHAAEIVKEYIISYKEGEERL